jgi:hypothetical protein
VSQENIPHEKEKAQGHLQKEFVEGCSLPVKSNVLYFKGDKKD